MPEDLLLELETPVPVAGGLEDIEALVRVVARELVLTVDGLRGSALRFEKAWKRIIADVIKGHAPEIHSVRPGLMDAFERQFGQIRLAHKIAEFVRGMGLAGVPDPAVLSLEIEGMGRFKANILDRWQTVEDLEDLVAANYHIPAARLEAIAAAHPAPPAWYEQDGKPF